MLEASENLNGPNLQTQWPCQPGYRLQSGLCAGKALGDFVFDLTHFTGIDKLARLCTNITGKN